MKRNIDEDEDDESKELKKMFYCGIIAFLMFPIFVGMMMGFIVYLVKELFQ